MRILFKIIQQKHFRSTSVKEFNSYDDRNFYFKVPAFQKVTIHPDLAHKVSFIQVDDEINNPHLKEICQDGYVLKVTNRFVFFLVWNDNLVFSFVEMFPLRQDSKDPSFTDAQNLLILHMAKVNALFAGMILKGSADSKI